jgi:hypothetical protein
MTAIVERTFSLLSLRQKLQQALQELMQTVECVSEAATTDLSAQGSNTPATEHQPRVSITPSPLTFDKPPSNIRRSFSELQAQIAPVDSLHRSSSASLLPEMNLWQLLPQVVDEPGAEDDGGASEEKRTFLEETMSHKATEELTSSKKLVDQPNGPKASAAFRESMERDRTQLVLLQKQIWSAACACMHLLPSRVLNTSRSGGH